MMSPVCVLLMFVCLQSGQAVPEVQTLNLKVEYGESAILPCNGSSFLGEEGSVHWETSMGEEVVTLQIGEQREGESSKFQVELPSAERLQRGDWSLRLPHVMLRDSGTYQCIWEGQRQGIVSTVWLTVKDPPAERHLTTFEGETVTLNCFLQISRSQTHSGLQSWWTLDGETLVSTELETELPLHSVYLYRFKIPFGTLEEFHLQISPTVLSDSGEYRCWYRTGDSESPRPGFPDRIQLTVLEKPFTATATDEWIHSTNSQTTSPTEEETTSSTPEIIPVFLEDSTQPTQDTAESELMEALNEMMTTFPDEESTPESAQWENLPWVRIGLIAGVLLVTAFALCVLKAQQKI